MTQLATLETATDKLNRVLRRIGDNLGKESKNGLEGWSRYALKRFVASRLSGGTGALQRRKGDLARSFLFEVSGLGLDSQTEFRTDSRYAAIHEEGGTIKPKRARALAIPVRGGPALTPAGVSRYASGDGQSLRNTLPSDYTFWIYRAPDGKVWLMGRKNLESGRAAKGKKTRAQAWFQLVKRVRIKPRMKFRESIRLYVKVFAARLRETAQKVFGSGK